MGDLADTYVTFAGIGPALATDEQIVGVQGTTTADYGAFVTVGNGGAVTLVSGGAFDGDDCIKLVPPDNDLGGDAAYCSVLRGANIWDDGANDVGVINFRFLFRMATRYIDLAPSPKWFSFGVASTLGGSRNDRVASFETYWAPSTGRVICVTADEVQEYHNPHITDVYSPDGDDTRKLCIVRNGAANHANDPPILGQEWVCIECQIDTRQDRGNANGRNKIKILTRDGVVDASLEIALNYDSGWNFTDQFISELEGLGWYFNDAGTANANNYIEFSHFVFSANRDKDDFIGPPPGFLESEDDTTPNAFTFTDQTSVALSSTITSAAITVSGIDAAATITVTGGTYDINASGTFVSTPGTVNNGDTVRARHTSSASNSTATNTVVTIGGVSDTFTSTTEAAEPGDDTTPDAFTFTDQTDVARSTVITSAAITVAGIDAPATISVSGGTYDINGSGTFVSTPGTVEVGDTVRARHTSSASYETATNTVVTIGGVSDTFTSTTEESEIIIPAHRWFRVPRR
jgi:hypothetical protein